LGGRERVRMSQPIVKHWVRGREKAGRSGEKGGSRGDEVARTRVRGEVLEGISLGASRGKKITKERT